MKGDFSRRTFDPAKQYSAVLQEQGRMLSDADLDEEHRILARHLERAAADLIGGCGAPLGAPGFAITPSGAEFEIGAGRFYADGILVENDAPVAFGMQPHRPGVGWPPPGAAVGRHLAYLDVWRRLVTALDDPRIREVALGGPTTAAREQTVWQVRTVAVADDATCLDPLPDVGGTTGQMAARADPGAAVTDPCDVPPSAGFKGLENQFYRVEVHDGGDAHDLAAAPAPFEVAGFPAGTTHQATMAAVGDLAVGEAVELFALATPSRTTFAHIVAVDGNVITLSRALPGFGVADQPRLRRVRASYVWSRENGSVVTTVERIDGSTLTVSDLGRDGPLGFAPGQWVELIDDRIEYEQQRGQLLRIAATDNVRRQIVVETPVTPLDAVADAGVDPARHPKLRRWEGAGSIRFGVAGPDGDWVHLEDGVQVRFVAGRYRTGDHWHFPARTATIDPALGVIEWPRDGAGDPALLPPHGVVHHLCPLALVDLVDPGDESLVVGAITDCRDLFPPVTELTHLSYVGGDAQERVAGAPGPLALPLQARVANGSFPVAGATVRFTITQGNGRVQGGGVSADVVTDAQGIASCAWALDGATPLQRCEARLLDAAGQPIAHQAVNFHARLTQRVEGGGATCCVSVGEGGDFPDVVTAIEALRRQDQRALCLCLLPGDHDVPGLDFSPPEPERPWSLTIRGCGWGTRLNVQDDMHVEGLAGFALHGLDVVVRHGATIVARQCREVRIDRCRISGIHDRLGVVRIHFASHVYVGHSIFEALVESELDEARRFLDGLQGIERLYSLGDWRDFERAARDVAVELAHTDRANRDRMADELRQRLARVDMLSRGEGYAYRRLAEALMQPELGPLAFLDHLISIRHAVLRLNPGVALEIGEIMRGREEEPSLAGTRDGAVVIEHNDIIGLVSFYGVPDRGRDFDIGTLRMLRGLLSEGQLVFDGPDVGVHVHNNRLTRLVIGAEMMTRLEELSDRRGVLEGLIASFHCTDNIIDGAISQFLAHHQALTSNEFSLSALRGVRGRESMQQRVADVVASSAIYTGNHGQNVGFEFFIHAQLVNATRAHAAAANLELEIVFG